MVDRSQLPHILRLVDDPSPSVRRGVAEALASFGDELDAAIAALDPPAAPELADAARDAVRAVLAPEPELDDDPFEVGQLVRHKRYGYRGIVVAVDETCRADDSWYRGNRTQPVREQPWYHVLVHDSEQVTYAAQSSLVADTSGRAVDHPLLEQFFDEVGEGLYLRNGREWPGWDAAGA